jgi:hypothetical protein
MCITMGIAEAIAITTMVIAKNFAMALLLPNQNCHPKQ